MRNIIVECLNELPLERQNVELVERKGIGHPDSICDGLAEAISRSLSREYLDRFGCIMHHNTDQVELVGGEANPVFGGGEVIKPMYILLSGRATAYVGDEKAPVGSIALEAARKYLKKNIRNLDVNYDVILDQRLGQGSSDLRNVFGRTGIPKSNDTSFGVGYAPLSLTEQLVLGAEKLINSGKIKGAGTDVKVMGVRNKNKITLTIACAMVSGDLKNMSQYIKAKEKIKREVEKFASKKTDLPVKVEVNTGDNIKAGSVFLTVTGTSAEQGDDGSVGRGNRANGLITPYRPISLEATSGKNPVNHVGKIYNLLSNLMASDIARKTGVEQAYVRLMSQIGKPIDKPLVASIQVYGCDGKKINTNKIRGIADYWLENVTDVTELCVKGKVTTF